MKPFDYIPADGTDAATRAARGSGAFIAGGTNLLDLMKLEV
jgi:xanthine dehydrogenase YagS FAD-binding subunit